MLRPLGLRLPPVLGDPCEVDVRDEVVGVGALETTTFTELSASANRMSETRSRTSSGAEKVHGGAEMAATRRVLSGADLERGEGQALLRHQVDLLVVAT